MSYLAKQKLIYYKKFKIDIWGLFKNTLQVLHDNTIYNCYNLLFNIKLFKKLLWKARIVSKYTKKSINFLKATVKEKAKAVYKGQFYHWERKQNYYKLRRLKHKLKMVIRFKKIKFLRLVLFKNLWYTVFKYTISRKLNKIFMYFLAKKQKRPKIFFWRPFIYESREPFIKYKQYKVNAQFASLRVIKLFYIIYNYRQLKQIAKKAKHQNGVFEQNYLSIIESKLPSYLYRTSFIATLFESIQFVKNNNAWINKQFKPLVYYSVKLFDIVGFRVFYKSYIYWTFFKRLRRKAFLFVFSRCIHVSFHFLFTILIARFTQKDIINSFRFDYYRLATYAQ
jgi:hypothetical protein